MGFGDQRVLGYIRYGDATIHTGDPVQEERILDKILEGTTPEQRLDVLKSSKTETELGKSKSDQQPIMLLDAIRLYVEAHRDEWSERTLVDYWYEDEDRNTSGHLDLFLWAFGNVPLASLIRDDVRRFKNDLAALPSNARSKKYKGLSFQQVIKKGENEKKHYSYKTIKDRFSLLKTMLEWCKREKLVDENVAEGLQIGKKTKKERTGPERQYFSDNELRSLFNGYIYRGEFQSKVRENYHFWFPLLAIFTGARISELAKLFVKHIYQDNDLWVFKIVDAKSSAGNRIFPVHSELINLGFLDYVQEVKNLGNDRVFPEITSQSRKGTVPDWSKKPSGWFNKIYRKKCGITQTDSTKVFHSFRHNAIRCMRIAGVEKHYGAEVAGHEKDTYLTGGNYGGRADPKELVDTVESMQYTSLDLSHVDFQDFLIRKKK